MLWRRSKRNNTGKMSDGFSKPEIIVGLRDLSWWREGGNHLGLGFGMGGR